MLGEKLRSEHQPIRREAAHALVRMRSAAGNRPLIEVLEGEDSPVKEDVISVVGDKFDEWHAADRFSMFPLRLLLKYDMYRWKVETLIENLKGPVGDPPEASDPTVVTEPPDATILGGWDGMSAEARDKYVREAISELRDGDWKSRMQATRMLEEAKGDRRVIGPLVFALRDDYEKVRVAAARVLGLLNARSAAEPLLFALRDESTKVSSAAIEALGRIGDERALAIAMQMARDADGDRRRSAVLALSYFARPESVDLLIDALDEKDHELVMAAVAALGSIDDPRVNKALVQFVNSNASSDARYVAVQAIAKRKDSVAMQGMLKALREGDEVTQVMAFTVLAQWNDPQSLGPLLMIAGRRPALAMAVVLRFKIEDIREQLFIAIATDDRDIRAGAVLACGGFVVKETTEAILSLVDSDDPLMRQNVIWALMRLGDQRAVEPLITELDREFAWTRIDAALALGHLGDVRAVDPLCRAIADDDPLLRRAAAVALGMIGDRRAVEPLIAALDDADERVVEEVARTLVILGDERVKEAILAKYQSDDQPSVGLTAALFASGWRPTTIEEVARLLIGFGRTHILAAMAPESTAFLIETLESSDTNMRYLAALALIRIGDEETIPALVAMLDKHPSKSVAELFGQSSHDKLGDAAREWYRSQERRYTPGTISSPPGTTGWGGEYIPPVSYGHVYGGLPSAYPSTTSGNGYSELPGAVPVEQ